MRKLILPVIVMVWSLMGCEKSLPTPVPASDYPINHFSDVFEAFWNGMNDRYVFWDWDTTNWDRVYQTYKAKFAALDTASLGNYVAQDSTLNYLKAITGGLIDGHYVLENIDSSGKAVNFRPLAIRKYKDPFFLANPQIGLRYFQTILPKRLDPGHVQSKYTIYQNDTVFAISGTIDQHILYLYFKSFHLQEFSNPNDSYLTPALNFFFQRFTADSSQYNGIIIDVRNNYGGSISDIDFLLGNIVAQDIQFGYTRTKTGNGRLDYSPWEPATLTHQFGGRALAPSQKIVVLADNWSQSAAEQLAMVIKVLPNSTFIGTTTWGANGPFQGAEDFVDFFAGTFNIGIETTSPTTTQGYGIVKTSSFMFKYINDSTYEGRGFPPDKLVPVSDSAALYSGIDAALDSAINFLHQ